MNWDNDSPPCGPVLPGLFSTPEEWARYEKASKVFLAELDLWHERQRDKFRKALTAQERDLYPNSTAIFETFAQDALRGDVRTAQAMLRSIAERADRDGAMMLSDYDRRFLAEALRRVAASAVAVSIVSRPQQSRGRKEAPGRPFETRKAFNIALAVGLKVRDGMTVDAAVAAVGSTRKSAPKSRAAILKRWSRYKDQVRAILAETPSL